MQTADCSLHFVLTVLVLQLFATYISLPRGGGGGALKGSLGGGVPPRPSNPDPV